MDMAVTDAEGVTKIALEGRFDVAGANEVNARFEEIANRAACVVVDLSKVTFIASLGVRTLMVSARTLIRRSGDMAVCGATEGVEKVLSSTGFDEIVNFYPDFSSAAKALTRRQDQFTTKKA